MAFFQEKKKPRYVYKTADELIATGSRKKLKDTDSALAKVKVIDMTGKEKRVLSGKVTINQQFIHCFCLHARCFQAW